MEPTTTINFILGIQAVTFLMVIYLVVMPLVTSGFAGSLRSVPQAINLGASHMSRRSDGVYEYERPMSFLGGPMGGEPPVFYDIGDVSAARAAIGGNMGKPTRSSASGFADLDDLLVKSQR